MTQEFADLVRVFIAAIATLIVFGIGSFFVWLSTEPKDVEEVTLSGFSNGDKVILHPTSAAVELLAPIPPGSGQYLMRADSIVEIRTVDKEHWITLTSDTRGRLRSLEIHRRDWTYGPAGLVMRYDLNGEHYPALLRGQNNG